MISENRRTIELEENPGQTKIRVRSVQGRLACNGTPTGCTCPYKDMSYAVTIVVELSIYAFDKSLKRHLLTSYSGVQ